VEHTEGDGKQMFQAICKLGLEGIVSKKLNAPYRSGPSKTWIKVKNPKAPAALAPSTAPSKRFSTVFSVPESGTVRTKIL
jgi:bifunctional non-homologous end joining protein LigD